MSQAKFFQQDLSFFHSQKRMRRKFDQNLKKMCQSQYLRTGWSQNKNSKCSRIPFANSFISANQIRSNSNRMAVAGQKLIAEKLKYLWNRKSQIKNSNCSEKLLKNPLLDTYLIRRNCNRTAAASQKPRGLSLTYLSILVELETQPEVSEIQSRTF